ncbi:MAG TPA: translation initiation factor eIF-1A [Thermoplasmata archaeon]|nr:translation initiation factor eIF-1A [Thermoplasmata archaeon]
MSPEPTEPEPTAPPEQSAPEPGPVVEVLEGGEEVGRLPLPRRPRGEIFALANQLMGAARIRVMGEDSIPRMGRITGKMKKKMWIREGDLLIIRPWGFQEGKADILFRYSRTQSQYLARRNLIPASVDLFSQPEPTGETPPAP